MSTTAMQDQVLASTQSRRTLIAPLYVQYEQHNRDEDPHVYRVVNLAFPLPSDDVRTWAGVAARPELESEVWVFQLMALMTETLVVHRIGGLQCRVNKRRDPVGYAKVVQLQARQEYFGVLKRPAERAFLQAHTTCTTKFDGEFMHDVAAAVARIGRAEAQAVKDKTKLPGEAKKKKGDDEEEEEAEEEDDEGLLERVKYMDHALGTAMRHASSLAAKMPERPPEPPKESLEAELARFPFNSAFGADAGRSVRLMHWDSDGAVSQRPAGGLMGRFTAAQLLTDPPQPLRRMAANYEPVIRAHLPEAMPDVQQRAAEARMAAWLAWDEERQRVEREVLDQLRRGANDTEPYTGPAGLVDKVRMCVTAVPHKDDPSGGRVAGLLVRFIIFDRSINPGQFLERLLENAENRRRGRVSLIAAAAASAANRRGGGPVEMFPSYCASFAQGHHPTATSTCSSDYLRHILAATKDGLLRQYKNKADLRAQLDYVNDAPTHLYK